MQSFRERYKAAKEKPTRGGPENVDYERFPLLGEALAGVPQSGGNGWDVPPHSLTIWLEGSIAKFCLGVQHNDTKTFGTFAELSDGLDGVEKALREGDCETKRVGGRMTR